MTASQPNLFTREDTIFGVCEGVGQDFGFNAQYLRVALAGLIFWNPLAAVGIYAALGVSVLASRLLFPSRATAVVAVAAAAPGQTPLIGENDAQPAGMAIAA
ncbi:MAG: PspC domain-containing protein [Sphingomonadaceae bacterium]|nr:PspC domain-containing protein [Sphingomonadaceae bacterium]